MYVPTQKLAVESRRGGGVIRHEFLPHEPTAIFRLCHGNPLISARALLFGRCTEDSVCARLPVVRVRSARHSHSAGATALASACIFMQDAHNLCTDSPTEFA